LLLYCVVLLHNRVWTASVIRRLRPILLLPLFTYLKLHPNRLFYSTTTDIFQLQRAKTYDIQCMFYVCQVSLSPISTKNSLIPVQTSSNVSEKCTIQNVFNNVITCLLCEGANGIQSRLLRFLAE
jgi:hypothetical protein